MSSKKFVARKRFIKNNIAAGGIGPEKVFSLTARTSKKSYVDTSVKKLSVIANLIRGKDVKEALVLLEKLPHKAAKILYKFVKSAMYNAKNNAGLNEDDLYIDRVDLGRGVKLKRYRFVARSRIHGYVKHRSFVRIVLDSK